MDTVNNTALDDEQLAVSKMLDAVNEQEQQAEFKPDDVEAVEISAEKQSAYDKIQSDAIAQLSGYGLLFVQQAVRWKTKNPNLVINPALQEQFGMILPDAMAEWGITAPDFLDKYAASMALGMTIVQIGADMSMQHSKFKKLPLGDENGKEADTSAVS